MTFKDYIKLKDRAREAGVAEDNPALKQLLHLIQAKQKAKEHFEAYLHDMNEWEKNCAKAVKDAIREACETGMAEVDWSQVEVDTPILVRYSEDFIWARRYFAEFKNGNVYAWNNGDTSRTAHERPTMWKYAKLAEGEE